MPKHKFGGIIISAKHFAANAELQLPEATKATIKITTRDGEVFEPTLVSLSREPGLKAMVDAGMLAGGSQVTLEATDILAWQKGVDGLMPAKEVNGVNYPEQPIHQLYGYTANSLTVIRSNKRHTMVVETDETQRTYARRLSFATLMDKAVDGVKSALGLNTPAAK